MAKRDYYDILGVSRNASDADIKQAYRRLAKKLHPDQNKGDKASEARFKEAHEAYQVLSDKEKRTRYDQFGHAGVAPGFDPNRGAGAPFGHGGVPVDFGDFADLFDFSFQDQGPRGGRFSFFDSFAGGDPSSQTTTSPASTQDIEYVATLSFEQAIRGTTLDLELSAPSAGTQRLSVHIPAGVRNGQKIRVRGKGKPGRGRRPAGDLFVVCSVQQHPYFLRQGDDIYLTVPVTITEATLGAKVDLPTLDGVRTVTIPPGTPSGTKLRLAGMGVANTREKSRGDHYAVIRIVPPTSLSAEQRDLLKAFAATANTSPRDDLWR